MSTNHWIAGIAVLITLIGSLTAIGISVGTVRTEVAIALAEIARLRDDVQGLENYIRDAFRDR